MSTCCWPQSQCSEIPSVYLPQHNAIAIPDHPDPDNPKKRSGGRFKKRKTALFLAGSYNEQNPPISLQVPSAGVFTAIKIRTLHVPGVHLLVTISACKKLLNLPKVCPPALPIPDPDLRHCLDHPPLGLATKRAYFEVLRSACPTPARAHALLLVISGQ